MKKMHFFLKKTGLLFGETKKVRTFAIAIAKQL